MATNLLVEHNSGSEANHTSAPEHAVNRTMAAYRGEKGIRHAPEFQSDLLLMDVSIPRTDALEAVRIPRAGETIRRGAARAPESCAVAGDNEKALEAGCHRRPAEPVTHPREEVLHLRSLGRVSAPSWMEVSG